MSAGIQYNSTETSNFMYNTTSQVSNPTGTAFKPDWVVQRGGVSHLLSGCKIKKKSFGTGSFLITNNSLSGAADELFVLAKANKLLNKNSKNKLY